MEEVTAARVVRKVRQKLELSQENLARLLNASKGAVQHWERGRNSPDIHRLLALREVCPAGAEKKELELLIKEAQSKTSLPVTTANAVAIGANGAQAAPSKPVAESLFLLKRENRQLRRQVLKLESTNRRRSEEARILRELAKELQREIATLRATQGEGAALSARGSAIAGRGGR